MKIKNILGLFLLVLIPIIGMAQNDLLGKTTNWNISAQTDLSSDSTMQQVSIVLVSDSVVVWGPSVEDGFPMAVTNISGDWDANTHIGNVTYNLQFEDGSGTAELLGDGNDLFITLNLTFINGSSRIKLKADHITYD